MRQVIKVSALDASLAVSYLANLLIRKSGEAPEYCDNDCAGCELRLTSIGSQCCSGSIPFDAL